MPLPASIRSLKAQLRTLSQPDFWSPALGLLLLMPLGWQIFNHFQQPSPVVKTPKPQSDPNATELIDSQSPTEDSATTADIENSAVLDRLLDKGVQPNSLVSVPPATANASDTFDRSANSQFDAYAVLDRFSSGRSTSTTTPASINPNPSVNPYASRSSIAQDILLAPYSANNNTSNNTTNNATPRSALQSAFLDNSMERGAVEAPATPNQVDVEESLALIEPPSPPAPSTLEQQTPPSLPLKPLPSSNPSTSLLPLPTPPLPTSAIEERILPPSPNPVPTSFNPNLNPVPTNLNPLPTPTQQTKLYPYVPERVYSSPLPALPPSGTGTNWNNNGLPPLPNPGISPQSQNPPTNPTAVAPIPPTGNSEIELQAVPFSVERLIGGGEINTFANP